MSQTKDMSETDEMRFANSFRKMVNTAVEEQFMDVNEELVDIKDKL